MKNNYLFTSERLGFRNWSETDLDEFALMNANPKVMEHFPATLTRSETEAFIQRLIKHFTERGYTYFATEIIETGELIGFIGLAYQDYESPYTPATDIGWRLKPSAWGRGYATEGARRCLDFAFGELQLEKVFAICTVGNAASENVMKKIRMKKMGTFNHPKLKVYPDYERCVCYQLEKV